MPIFIDNRRDLLLTCWRRVKMAGITEEAARRRIKCYSVDSKEELLTLLDRQEEPSSLVLILASNEELQEARQEYADLPIHTIVFAHHIHDSLQDEFSYVMSDIAGAMRKAVLHLRERGCRRLALFGVDFTSNHDYCRVETFKRVCGTEEPLIFDLANGLTSCVRDLLAAKEPIDGLLCINDFCALRLMHALDAAAPDWREKMLMLGFVDATLSALHSPSLTSTSLNYFDGGREVVTIHRHLAKNPSIAHLHTVMESRLQERNTTKAQDPVGICFAELPPLSEEALADALHMQDPLMALENLLSEADDTPLRLLLGLMRGRSVESIAKDLFISKDGLLYHLRKLKRAFNMDSAKAMTAFLHRWVDADKLEDYIQ